MPQVNVKSPVFATKEEAQDWRTKYLQNYHPCGYGTTVAVSVVPGGFVVSGYRWSTCD